MIQPGDFLLLYNSDKMNYLVQVPAKGRFSTHRGGIEYSDVLGCAFGDSVQTHMGIRFHLLRPTLADLGMKVKRTTTVVYPKDTGYVLLQVMVFPGARVIECGSGSGALTTILANFVRPDGRVYSYERRPEFSANAQANVRRYRLEASCEFYVSDPAQSGFLQSGVDAVLLDVPEPWSLVRSARNALLPGNVMAAIVPTVEQVRRTVSEMETEGFARIRVRELLERGWFVRTTGMRPADRMVAHTVYLIFGHTTSGAGKVETGPDPECPGEVDAEARGE